jgi:hypothetical protein
LSRGRSSTAVGESKKKLFRLLETAVYQKNRNNPKESFPLLFFGGVLKVMLVSILLRQEL